MLELGVLSPFIIAEVLDQVKVSKQRLGFDNQLLGIENSFDPTTLLLLSRKYEM